MKYLKITWLDAGTSDGWVDIADIAPELPKIVSVGCLVHEDDKAYTLALSVDSEGIQANGLISIPKGWVESVTLLL